MIPLCRDQDSAHPACDTRHTLFVTRAGHVVVVVTKALTHEERHGMPLKIVVIVLQPTKYDDIIAIFTALAHKARH